MLASGTIANGGSFSLSNSWKAGDAAGPAKILITGAQGTVECGWGGYNNGNEIVTTIKGQAATTESVDGPFPNTRTTMYYQLTVRKTQVFVRHFLVANEHVFTKTGSGQAYGNVNGRMAFFPQAFEKEIRSQEAAGNSGKPWCGKRLFVWLIRFLLKLDHLPRQALETRTHWKR
eukprot:COSAG06_NODE_315_length_17722_cov_10.903535_11_plen_174_part_00